MDPNIQRNKRFIRVKWAIITLAMVSIISTTVVLIENHCINGFTAINGNDEYERSIIVLLISVSVVAILLQFGLIGVYKENFCSTLIYALLMCMLASTSIVSSIMIHNLISSWISTALYFIVYFLAYTFARNFLRPIKPISTIIISGQHYPLPQQVYINESGQLVNAAGEVLNGPGQIQTGPYQFNAVIQVYNSTPGQSQSTPTFQPYAAPLDNYLPPSYETSEAQKNTINEN